MLELTEFLIKSIVRNEDAVVVKQFDDEDMVTISVLVDKDDMGRVIGKAGRTIKSIRTVVNASSYLNHGNKVKIEVDSF